MTIIRSRRAGVMAGARGYQFPPPSGKGNSRDPCRCQLSLARDRSQTVPLRQRNDDMPFLLTSKSKTRVKVLALLRCPPRHIAFLFPLAIGTKTLGLVRAMAGPFSL